jgi:hypothetical protein
VLTQAAGESPLAPIVPVPLNAERARHVVGREEGRRPERQDVAKRTLRVVNERKWEEDLQ